MAFVHPILSCSISVFLSGLAGVHDSARFIQPETRIKSAGPDGYVWSMAFSHDGGVLAAGTTGRRALRVWDLPAGTERLSLEHSNVVRALWLSEKGDSLLAAHSTVGEIDNYSVVKRWDLKTGRGTALFAFREGLGNLAISPDGKWLVTNKGYPNPVAKVWEIETGKLAATLDAGKEFIHAACAHFSADGRTLAIGGGREATVIVYDASSFKERRRAHLEGRSVQQLALDPKGKFLGCYARTIYETGRRLRGGLQFVETSTWKTHPFDAKFFVQRGDPVFQFFPVGQTVAVTGDKGVNLVTFPQGNLVTTLAVPVQGVIKQMAISPDGTRLAAYVSSGTILVWRIAPLTKGL